MREPGYDPLDIKTFSDLNALAITLTVCLTATYYFIDHNHGMSIQVIGGRHFVRQGKGAVTSMFVDIEIVGAETDCCKMKTTTIRKSFTTNNYIVMYHRAFVKNFDKCFKWLIKCFK